MAKQCIALENNTVECMACARIRPITYNIIDGKTYEACGTVANIRDRAYNDVIIR